MRYLFILLLCCGLTHASGQHKLSYGSQNYIGLLQGEAKGAFQLQTIHGVKYKTWYGAVGAGLDYYLYRSVPVFLTLNKDIVINERIFFISGDIGKNYPWVSEGDVSIWGWTGTDDYSPGLYWSGGLGYKAFFKNKKDAIIINLGYSFKRLKRELANSFPCAGGPCEVNTERYDYQMNRLSMRIGWQF